MESESSENIPRDIDSSTRYEPELRHKRVALWKMACARLPIRAVAAVALSIALNADYNKEAEVKA